MPFFISRFRLSALLYFLIAPIVLGAQSGQGIASVPGSVVVVPFANLTGDPAEDWIGVGIAETVTAEIESRIDLSITVISIDSPNRNGGNGLDEQILLAARGRAATHVLTGTYQRSDSRVRIIARLVEVANEEVSGVVTVDGSLADLFLLQDRVAIEIEQVIESVHLGQNSSVSMSRELAMAGGQSERADSQRGTVSAAPPSGPIDLTGLIDGPPAPIPPAVMRRDEQGRTTVRAIKVDEGIRLDGVLDEAVYSSIPAISDFIQQVPQAGAPATERTEAWILFDEVNIYVSARVWDSAPESEWIANEMRRDTSQLRQNDTFTVFFDTFYDRRNGFNFYTNPLGARADQQFTNEGNPNGDWNPVWDVRTGRFDGGWTVEMEIPFKTLRYRSGTPQVWGIQLRRAIRRKNEWVYLTRLPIAAGGGSGSSGIFRVSAAGTLVGIEPPPASRNIEIKPYAIGGLTTDRTAVPPVNNQIDGDFGLDVKYGITENLTADFTYNTDFAQVEVDEQQVNLTRFGLFFPEKREFFLEGRGIFQFASGGVGGRRPGGSGGVFGGVNTPTLFYSRRIGLQRGRVVPILGGGRVTGKIGPFDVGAVNIQTDDEARSSAESTNFTVLRLKRDILRRSSIGGIFTNRSVSTRGHGSSQTYGVDSTFAFYDNLSMLGYLARTETPGLIGKDSSYQAKFDYAADRYGLQVDHLLVEDNFVPDVGFVRRDNFRRTFVEGRFSPRPQSIDRVRQFTLTGSTDYILVADTNILETRLNQFRFNTQFETSDQLSFTVNDNYELLAQPFSPAPSVTLPVGGYGFSDVEVGYSIGQQRRVNGQVSVKRGGYFSGEVTALTFRQGRVSVLPQMSVEPSVSFNWIDTPQGSFRTDLAMTRVNYAFNPRMFFSGLVQYNSANDTVSNNFRFRWEYSPGSEFFVVYTEEHTTDPLRPDRMTDLQNRGLVIKFNRLFRF